MFRDSERSTSKESFYQNLASLGDSDEDDVDLGRRASEDVLKKASTRKTTISEIRYPGVKNTRRSKSETNLVEDRNREVPGPIKQVVPDIRETEAPKPPSSVQGIRDVVSPPTSHGKRKRDMLPVVGAEGQKLFSGLQFYFFPNNNVAPARRMRINKAIEFGATWQKDWTDNVTHIILDKAMTFGDLLKYLKLQSLPDGVVVVHENYPAECISYRTLVDPKLKQFEVKGYKPREMSREATISARKSLELKPASANTRPRVIETQNQVENGDIVSKRPNVKPHHERVHPLDKAKSDILEPEAESNDEFQMALRQAQALQDLPLDDEDDSGAASASEEAISDRDDRGSQLPLSKKQKSKSLTFQDRFQCMQKHTGEKTPSPNQSTIDILQQMADHYTQTNNEWRARAYRNVIASLRRHPTRIATRADALRLPHVGARLADKIEEIVLTQRLRRLDTARAEPHDQTLRVFTQIHGVGLAQASRWVAEGFTSIESLLASARLSPVQRIGAAHFEDFRARIPRAEVAAHARVVRLALRRIDPAFEVVIGGSYRRGALDSGDIDCILTRPGAGAGHLREVVLGQLVPRLFEEGFLVATLAGTMAGATGGKGRDDGSKWLGASRLPGQRVWRRMDLLLVPWDEMGAALIYFTGNDIFNRSLRLLAKKKGMRLNQRGLYRDVFRDGSGIKRTEGTLIESKDEKRIFEILGVPWRPPEHRVC